MRNASMPCPTCSGTGSINLPDSLATTFAMFTGKRELCALDCAELSKDAITINGWSNRLSKLHRAGLLKRRRVRKFWMYSRG